MIALVTRLKDRHRLKIVVVSNEARELNAYRIRQFKLTRFVDAFISSCFVHVRKPDAEMFRLALDVAQVPAERVVFIDDTPMFVDDRAGPRDSKHSSHGLSVHLRAAGRAWIARAATRWRHEARRSRDPHHQRGLVEHQVRAVRGRRHPAAARQRARSRGSDCRRPRSM